jgi:hypothetical protein
MTTSAVLGWETLSDVINSYTSLDGQAQYISAINVLAKKCPFMKALPAEPSNQIMSNIGSRVSYLPTIGTRQFNYGVAPTATHDTPFNEDIAMFEDYSRVDKALWQIQNNPNQWRSDRDMRKMEAMSQSIENALLYGNRGTDPSAINGLCVRYNSLTRRPNGSSTEPYHVVSAGGSGGDTTSVILVEPGPAKVKLIYPKNMPAGLTIEDRGQQTVNLGSEASPMYLEMLISHFTMFLGLDVEDERCIQRYTNIEVSGSSNIFDEDQLIAMINNLPSMGEGPGTFILAGRKIKTQLDIRAKDKNNVQYGPDAVWGPNVTKFRGIPILLDEMLSETETAVA